MIITSCAKGKGMVWQCVHACTPVC